MGGKWRDGGREGARKKKWRKKIKVQTADGKKETAVKGERRRDGQMWDGWRKGESERNDEKGGKQVKKLLVGVLLPHHQPMRTRELSECGCLGNESLSTWLCLAGRRGNGWRRQPFH